jgi:hypothetical protein
MTWIDYMSWLSAGSEKRRREVWQECHPGKPVHYYTFCPDIKAFWRSPLGRIYKDFVMLIYRIESIPRKIHLAVWWLRSRGKRKHGRTS